MIKDKSNSVSQVVKLTSDEIVVSVHQKGSQLNDIDVVAINEWIELKSGGELYQSLRAIALLCTLTDGLDELFFTIAKQLPEKLEIKDLSMEEIFKNLKGVDKKLLSPYDYIKTLQNIFEQTEKTKTLVGALEHSFLDDTLDVLKTKFKIISKDEYEKLKNGVASEINSNLFDFANNIGFSRTFLRQKNENN